MLENSLYWINLNWNHIYLLCSDFKNRIRNMSEPPAKIMEIVDECGYFLHFITSTFSCLYFLNFSQPIEYINPKNIIKLLKMEYSQYNYDTDSPVNSTERHLAKMFVKKMRKYEEYFVIFCFDVFLDVLRFGNRRQLIKLEHIGRRLHLSVEKFFGEMPFLCLNLKIEPHVSGYCILIILKV